MIVREGSQWALKTKDGKRTIHRFPTRAKALAAEIAINISKARKAGHRIPRKKGGS